MKIVSTGTVYRVYDNTLLTYDSLPAKTYQLQFSKREGFFLEEFKDLSVDEKIYGVHPSKVTKILNSFKAFSRNLGVILSGEKGIGKSICAKLLAQQGVSEGYPVILVNDYFPGIADYIGSIEQEVIVIFDEFDKTFRGTENDEDGPQVELLTLFDGMYSGKKLFVITCNNVGRLNEFLVNRPGRFHYHLRFDYPTANEVREYLKDKVKEEFYGEIEKVVRFSGKTNINYDCLRAIAFELNNGETFESAIKDLNIVNTESSTMVYIATVMFDNGITAVNRRVYLDVWNEYEAEEKEIGFSIPEVNDVFEIAINAEDLVFDSEQGIYIVKPERFIRYNWEEGKDYMSEGIVSDKQGLPKPTCVTLKRKPSRNIHYAV